MDNINAKEYGFEEELDPSSYGFNEEKSSSPQSQVNPSFLDKLSSFVSEKIDPINSSKFLRDQAINLGVGGKDELVNLVKSGVNLFRDEDKQLPYLKNSEGFANDPEGLAYKSGEFMGALPPYLLGGGIANTGLNAARSIPKLGKLAESLASNGILPSLVKGATGGSAFGALENPENRGIGAAVGGTLGGTLGGLLGAIPKTVKDISPKEFLPEVYHTVRSSLHNANTEARKLYGSVLDKFGDQPILIKNLEEDLFRTSSKLKEKYKEFVENPTINKAHKLQSQLGSAERSVKGTDIGSLDRRSAYGDARDNILESINKSLGSKYPEAADRYLEASQYFKDNVVPLRITQSAINRITHPTPEKVSRTLESVTKKDIYPKVGKEGFEQPLVPENIRAIQELLDKRIRNRNVSQLVPNYPLLGHARGIMEGLGRPLTGNIAEKYRPENNPIYKGLIQSIAQSLSGRFY